MPVLGVNNPPQTRAIVLPRHESLKAETRYNSDNTPYQVVRLYNGTGGALTANRPYLVTFSGASETAQNPRVTALADTAAVSRQVVVALEATADASWGWFAFQGYVECGVEGTTDVAAGDFLLVSAGVSTTGFVKDGTTRTRTSCAIACEAQAANSVVTTRVYLLGDIFQVTTAETATSLALGGGTESAPSLFFTGDANTGIYSPAADQIALTAAGAQTLRVQAGLVTIVDGSNLATGAVTGMKIGTAATQKLGFFNAAPIVQPGAYTQTYATADKTHANPTATALTHAAVSGTADGTLVDCTSTYSEAAVEENFKECATAINALIVDLADLKQLVNSVIDDLQALGLAA